MYSMIFMRGKFKELLGREQRLRVRATATPNLETGAQNFHSGPPDNNLEAKFLSRDCVPLLLRRNTIQEQQQGVQSLSHLRFLINNHKENHTENHTLTGIPATNPGSQESSKRPW